MIPHFLLSSERRHESHHAKRADVTQDCSPGIGIGIGIAFAVGLGPVIVAPAQIAAC